MTVSPALSIKRYPLLAARATLGSEEFYSTSAKGAPWASRM